MISVDRYIEGYGSDGEQNTRMRFGKLLHEVDTAGNYEVSEAKLYQKDDRYALLAAFGCSCWDGDYEGWEDMTSEELLAVAQGWADQTYGDTEIQMGKWILVNVSQKANR